MLEKAKVYKKQLEDSESIKVDVLHLCGDFLSNLPEADSISDNVFTGKVRDLDNKFQACIPEKHAIYKKKFRQILIEADIGIKEVMLWA